MNIISIFLFLFLNFCFANSKEDMMFIYNGTYTPLFKNGDASSNSIRVNDFFLDKYQISNLDFLVFILNNPSWDVNNIKSVFADSGYLNHWSELDDFILISYKPVVNVSWFSAEYYCEFFKKRLPSVNEWEYVGSAGKVGLIGKHEYSYWENILAWYINSQSRHFLDVYDMPCNFFGIFGMHEFIWEWVYDFNSIILINSDAEGGGLEELLYCGATATNAIDPSDYIAFMRFAFRNTLEAIYTMNKLGFRCAKDVK